MIGRSHPSSTGEPMKKFEHRTALLEAHVAFVVEQLQGKALAAWLERTLPPTLEDLTHLRLDQLVPARTVKASVAKIAQNLEIDRAFRETVQAITAAILESEAHDDVTLGDLLPQDVFEAGRDKAVTMQSLRETMIRSVMGSRAYQNFVSDLLYHGIRGWLSDNPLTQNLPGAKSAMALGRSMLQRARPGLGDSLDERLHEYIDKSVHATAEAGERYALGISEEQLASGADAVWRHAKKARVSALLADLSAEDAEDWSGIVYDGLHHLRQSDYLVALIDAGVDAFYADFGKRPISELLDILGITEEVIAREIKRYVEPAVKQLKKQKLLEDAVRRQLAPFYESEACRAVLED